MGKKVHHYGPQLVSVVSQMNPVEYILILIRLCNNVSPLLLQYNFPWTHWPCQDNPRNLWKTKVHYYGPQFVSMVSQMNPIEYILILIRLC